MAGNSSMIDARRWNGWRIAGWGMAVILLLVPLVAMRFGDEVNWSAGDFAVAGALIGGVGVGLELAARRSSSWRYRTAAALAIGGVFLLVWINLAVGIIGSERNPANAMFAAVLAVGFGGAAIARFEPMGMARALVAAAIAQVLVGVMALVADAGAGSAAWPMDVVGLTGAFTALWLASAWLFRSAARGDEGRAAA